MSYINAAEVSSSFCTTQDDCVAAAADMGVMDVTAGDFPTKGCFKKKNNIFYSQGTTGPRPR